MAQFKSERSTEVSPKDTETILSNMLHPKIKDNLYAWVMYSFPWGQKNTPLEHHKGPRDWQKDELDRISAHIAENKNRVARGEVPLVYRSATVSGRGPGKSALVAWLSLWNMSCNLGASTIISANTQSQLSDKTFAEIGNWLTLFIGNHLFDRNQTKIVTRDWFANQIKDVLKIDSQYHYVDGVLWNEDNPDAFAGLHNPKGVMLIFDEASGIPQPIWTVSEGFFTDISMHRLWFVFSNGRKNTGPFFECFNRNRVYWNTRKIDCRTVEGLDQTIYRQIIEKYGEDSDEARIEVLGEFPKQGDRQFISNGVVRDAQARQLERYDDHAALVMGIDPARFGDDSTVIRFRRGRDARSIPATVLKGCDNMKVANICADLIDRLDPDAVFCDAGAGAGIIDRLREMDYKIIEVWFGSASESPEYADHRTELWARMREWLGGSMIDNDPELATDLTAPEYEFAGREDKIKLESKEKMKRRGMASPDRADALAVTFHAKVARRDITAGRSSIKGKSRKAKGLDYKIF